MHIVSNNRPEQTFKDIVAAAKANPDKWSFATAQLGAPGHLAAVAFNQYNGLNLPIIVYRGTAPAANDVVGGHVPMMIEAILSLLPLVRGVIAGLDSVPEAVIESARGMGMNRVQIFFRVQLPIALPVILTGIRIVAVQTVGMAMVAALIGAGGLGAIMFQGLLSSALDLVLLGVIPAVLMAVVVDSLFKFAVSLLETSRR